MSDADTCTIRAMLEMKQVTLKKTVSFDIERLDEARMLTRMGYMELVEETEDHFIFKATEIGKEWRQKMPKVHEG